ncbi:FxsA family protein [Sansalvadorimonas sp. 2012CJ34-2]|uniref:FxsA family protein n=1 Tax=Parendozoicomonas callyspongiae TaxID=2942213 RepID=A0ABT0PJ35_9GAMM|nr:FxsA family protein [Sansalvadorimonas sp. 2012CJ34-2]MCL6271399.1 FxsA family protein [Sansalvadorimonas sp. 2012CJ34-2]
MRLGFFLLVLFPITELMILIKVGGLIGVIPTVGLILFTASMGLFLLRQEGFSILMRARQRMNSGEIPAMEMMEGLVIAFCGALLLAPGFITDCIALCGLIAPIRRKVIKRMISSPRFKVYTSGGMGARSPASFGASFGAGFDSTTENNGFGENTIRQSQRKDVIDGEYRREE